MINEKFNLGQLTPQNFKNYVLKIEQENLKNIDKVDKKGMVSQIIRVYEEESRKDGNR